VTAQRRNKPRSTGPRGMAGSEEEQRRYTRKILDEPKWLECEGVGCELHGHLSVIGLGGGFIRTRNLFPVGSALGLRFRKGNEWLEAVCVVRSNENNGMGIEFMPPRNRLATHLNDVIGDSNPQEPQG
jgi:PilZ domain